MAAPALGRSFCQLHKAEGAEGLFLPLVKKSSRSFFRLFLQPRTATITRRCPFTQCSLLFGPLVVDHWGKGGFLWGGEGLFCAPGLLAKGPSEESREFCHSQGGIGIRHFLATCFSPLRKLVLGLSLVPVLKEPPGPQEATRLLHSRAFL